MENSEIDKLLTLIDLKDLEKVREFLLKEKEKNNTKIRQLALEEYLTHSIFSLKNRTNPSLYIGDYTCIFTNNVSIYIVNKKYFNLKATYLKKLSLTHLNTFENISKKDSELIINYTKKINNQIYVEPLSIQRKTANIIKDNTISVQYLYNKNKHIDYFSENEINLANQILDNPTFKISVQNPILKAESDIGKCYILGVKN